VLERLSEDAPPPESDDVELIVSTLLNGIVSKDESRRQKAGVLRPAAISGEEESSPKTE
jgi:hypothetical protein